MSSWSLLNTGTAEMHSRSCRCCFRNYILALEPGAPNSRPYLLVCGHVFCGACLQDKGTHTGCEFVCPTCKMVTRIPGAGGLSQLPLDYYSLGVLAAYNYSCGVPRSKQNLGGSQLKLCQPLLTDGGALTEARGIPEDVRLNLTTGKERCCAECERQKAILSCKHCQEDFCDSCFKKVHGNAKVLKNHKAVKIDPSDCKNCVVHGKLYAYCCELGGGGGGSGVACADCIADSEHNDHDHTLLDAKKEELSMQLPKAIVAGQARVLKLKEALREFENLQSELQLQLHTVVSSIHESIHSLCSMVQARGAELVFKLKDMEVRLHPILTRGTSVLHESLLSNCVTLDTACRMARGHQFCTRDVQKVVDQLLTMDVPELCSILLEDSLDLQCDLDATQLIGHIKELGTILFPTRLLEYGKSMSAATGSDQSPVRAKPLSPMQQQQARGSHATTRGYPEKGPIGPGLKLTLNLQGLKHTDPPTAMWSKKGGAVCAAAAPSSASLARCLFPGISEGMMTAGGETSSVQRCKIGNAKSSRNRPSWISQDAIHSEQVMLTHVVNPRHFYVQYYAARYRNEKLNLALSKYCMAQTKNSSAIQTLSIGEVLCMRSCVSNKWHRIKIISIRAGEELCGSVQAEGGEGTASLGLLRSIALQSTTPVSHREEVPLESEGAPKLTGTEPFLFVHKRVRRVFDERESKNDAALGVATAAEMTSSVEAGHVDDEGIVRVRGGTAGQTLHAAERNICGLVEADYLSECTHPQSPGVCGSITSSQKREDANGKCADARGKGDIAKLNFSTEKSAERAQEICETSEKIGVVSDLLTCSEGMEMIDGVLECGWEHEDNCAAAPDRHPVVEGEAQASADTQSSKPALVSQGASSFPIDKVTRLNVFLVDEGRMEVFYVRSKCALKQSRRNAACAVSDLQPHLRRPDHELLNLFEKVPAAAVRCALKDVVPFVAGQGWSAESSKVFAQMLQGQIVHMVVAARAGDAFIVDLVKSPHNQVENDVPVSLRDALVFLELARFQCDSVPLCVPDHRPGRRPAFIPPSNLQPFTWLSLRLSHINSPSDFYVQQVSTTKCLQELKGALQRFYREYRNDWTIVHPTVGQLCVAQFSADQQWYRAQVIGLPGKGDVEVRYVDYGNTEHTSVSCIRKLGNLFLQLPELAVPCTLADICANGECWTVAAMERFHQIVDNKHLWSLVTDNRSGNHVSVHLFVEPAQLLSKILVDEGFAQRFGLRSVSMEALKLARERAAVQEDVPEGPCGVEAAAVWWSGRACQGTTTMPTRAFVSFVRSPASFYLQPDEALGNFLPTLKEMLEERFGGKPRPLAQGSATAVPASGADFAVGSLCALYSTNHRTWARARIQSLRPDSQIQVLLLDYGDAAVVAPSELRPIDMACSRYPAMAIHCCLACLMPTGGSAEWSAGACDFLSDAISEKYCYVKEMGEMERDDPLPVQLTCGMEGDIDHLRDIGSLLVLQGLAFHVKRPNADPGVVHRRMGEDIVAACVREMSRMVVPPQQWAGVPYLAPDLPASNTFSLVVSHVSARGRIYGHLASNDAVLQKLMESIDLECGSNNNSSLTGLVDVPFLLGQPCVVQLSGGWYRGQILNVQTNTVQVRYVDHGGEDEVEPGAVRVTDRFTHVPPLCLECVPSSPHLDKGDAQKAEVVEYLSRMLCGQTVSMTLKVPFSEASLPLQVDVYTEQQGSLEALLALAEPLDGEQCSPQGQGPMENERKPTSTEGRIQVRELPHLFESVVVHAVQVDDSGEEKSAGLGALGEWGKEEEDEEDMAATERPGGSGDQDEQEEDVMWDEPLVFTLKKRPTSFSFMTLPPPGHYYPVSVTHLELPNQVYIRLSASTRPTPLLEGQEDEQGLNPNLIAALIKIHTSPIRLSPLKDFNVGSLCMAPFSEDGRWCRARVKCGPRTLAGGDGVLLVEYVDFGSCYEHRPSELRAIPVELLEFPVQTVQVRLWGISPPPFEDPASAAAGAGERLPYGPEWPRCALLALRSCVDGVPLVASTVTDARGPCVALYHAAEPGGPLVYQHIPEEGLAQWEVGAEGARPPKHG